MIAQGIFLSLLGTPPMITDDPGTVEDKVFEIETGQEFMDSESGYFQWKFGFADRLEFDMAVPWHLGENRDVDQLELSSKWAFFAPEGEKLPGFSLAATWVPGVSSFGLCGITGYNIGPVELLGNVWWEQSNPTAGWGLAGVFSPTQLFSLGLEITGEDDLTAGGGVRLFPKDFLMLDAGYHITMSEESQSVGTVGLIVDF